MLSTIKMRKAIPVGIKTNVSRFKRSIGLRFRRVTCPPMNDITDNIIINMRGAATMNATYASAITPRFSRKRFLLSA